MRRHAILIVLPAFLAGCALSVEMPETPEGHPARVDAGEAPYARPSGLLAAHHPIPGAEPDLFEGGEEHLRGLREGAPLGNQPDGQPAGAHEGHEGHGMEPAPAEPPRPEPGITPEMTPEPGFTCTMHPEVEATEPGYCPVCGMTLVPAEPAMPAEAGHEGHEGHGGHGDHGGVEP